MKNWKRGIGIVTALALGVFSFTSTPLVFGEEIESSDPSGENVEVATATTEPEKTIAQQLDETEKDDFVTLAYLSLCAYAKTNLGYADVLSESDRVMLDVDHDNDVSPTDAFVFLTWYANYQLSGTYSTEAFDFLDTYFDGEMVTATTTTTTETTAETPVATSFETTSSTAYVDGTTSTETITTTSETTVETTTSTTQAEYYGIDVSVWQGAIDWEKVAADGMDFAMIRAGYGFYASNEPNFETNMQGAQENGIACGAYWFCTALNETDAITQAEKFLNTIQGYQFEYPLVLDMETTDQMTTISTSERDAIVTAFCSVLEDAGYYVAIYSSKSYLETMFSYDTLKNYDVWVAHWTYNSDSRSTYSRTSFGLWQYSDQGSVAGISGDVDLDMSFKNYLSIMKNNHLNGY